MNGAKAKKKAEALVAQALGVPKRFRSPGETVAVELTPDTAGRKNPPAKTASAIITTGRAGGLH